MTATAGTTAGTAVPTRRRAGSPPAVAGVAAVLVALFVVAHLAANSWQVGAFAVFGDGFVDRSQVTGEVAAATHPDSFGYDGQFVYRLALDPLSDRETEHGIRLDNPAYRQQRIGLPALAWAVAGATPLSPGWALVAVNGLALVAACWLGAAFAVRYGRHPAWGLLVGLSPNLVVAFARDLTEPLAWALLLGALLAWLDRRLLVAAALFTAAALTRETTLAVAGGMGVWQAVAALRTRNREHVVRAVVLLVPLAAVVGWQLWLRSVWGTTPFVAAGSRGAPPVLGVIGSMLHHNGSWLGLDRRSVLNHLWLVERWLLAALYVVVAGLLRRTRLPLDLRVGWVFGAFLGLTPAGWHRDVQFLRFANEAISIAVLVLLATPGALARRTLLGIGGVSLAVAGTYAFFL